jgi:hypothetical protein
VEAGAFKIGQTGAVRAAEPMDVQNHGINGRSRALDGQSSRRHATIRRARMLELLGWPGSSSAPTDTELYVSREIHWWMVYPPYAVPIKFVQVDALNAWLNDYFDCPT